MVKSDEYPKLVNQCNACVGSGYKYCDISCFPMNDTSTICINKPKFTDYKSCLNLTDEYNPLLLQQKYCIACVS